ncbi:hypothetical protein H0H93_013358, partial [Arthromyces matolae]
SAAQIKEDMLKMIQDAPTHPDAVLTRLGSYINQPAIPVLHIVNASKLHESEETVAAAREGIHEKLKVILEGCKTFVGMNNVDNRIRLEAQRGITQILRALNGSEAFEEESSAALGSSA